MAVKTRFTRHISQIAAICSALLPIQSSSTLSYAQLPVQPIPLPTPSTWQKLFTITRTTNRNEVVYEVGLDPSGEIYVKNPARVYWILHEKGGVIEGLNPLELLSAYGFSIQKVTPKQADLLVRGFPEVPVRIHRDTQSKTFIPQATVDGKEIALQSIFLHVVEGGILPKVTQADFKGFSISDRKPIELKIPIKKLSKSRYDD